MHKFSLLTSAGCTQVSVGQTDRQTHRERLGVWQTARQLQMEELLLIYCLKEATPVGEGCGSRRWWWTWGGRGELLQKLTHQQLQSALALAHNLLTRWAQVSCQKLDSSSISSIPAQPQPPKTGWQKIHILSMLFHWSSSSNSNSS